MDQTLAKAMGVAVLLHVMVGVSAQRLLAPKLRLRPPETRIAPESLPQIAIEFLPPPVHDIPKIVSRARAEAASPTAEISNPRPAPRPTRASLATSARPNAEHANAEHANAEASASTTQPPEASPQHGALSMRGAPATAGLVLDPRLALAQPGNAPPGPGQGQARPDLLASGMPTSDAPSVWRPSGGGTMRATKQPFHAKIKRDGKIEFRDKPNVQIEGVKISETYGIPVLVGRFDVTDAVMASLGDTLYPYRKMKLMDESREMRSEMALASKAEDLRQALKTYKKHLRRVWSHPGLSLAKRRKALFLLWDECAETGSAAVVASAKSIRAMTITFIQANLAETSELAYTKSELAEYNRLRRSRERFSPYN